MAGGVDENVDPAEGCHDLLNHRFDLMAPAEIRLQRESEFA